MFCSCSSIFLLRLLSWICIPSTINIVAEYPIAALKAAPQADLARDFVKLVLSKEGQKVLAAAGFNTAEGQEKK